MSLLRSLVTSNRVLRYFIWTFGFVIKMLNFGRYAVALYDTTFWFIGQTDTASVLSEATEYIQFLHEQLKVRL